MPRGRVAATLHRLRAAVRLGAARLRRACVGATGRRWRNRQRLGRRAERRAERHLRRQGLRVVARNYARRTGEIDLVMLDGASLVFVEVRYRGPSAWTLPLTSVDAAKQRRLVRTAELYRRDHPEHRFRTVRFDVVAVTKRNYALACEWIRSAFDAGNMDDP